MADDDDSLSLEEKYIVVLRIIQPARITDVLKYYQIIWGDEMNRSTEDGLRYLHGALREQDRIISVRKGTYVLTDEGMRVAAQLIKPRHMDNARMFLMKEQRRSYHRLAGRPG